MEVALYSMDEIDRLLWEMDIKEGQDIRKLMEASQDPTADDLKWLEEPPKNKILGWGQGSSIWPMFLGLACCAMEFISTTNSRFDQGRFGMEIVRPSPRQADLLLCSGTLTWKMAPKLRMVWEQMAEPRYVIAMGACAISGGTFASSYSVVPGVNHIFPVDVYIPGCPVRPEGLINGYLALRKKIKGEHP